jgi:hypothetical protein
MNIYRAAKSEQTVYEADRKFLPIRDMDGWVSNRLQGAHEHTSLLTLV